MKVLAYEDLKPAKGIGYSKCQIWRLEKSGEFPRRINLGANRVAWIEQEIDAWLAAKVAERDASVTEAA